jgi:hypothetical protein
MLMGNPYSYPASYAMPHPAPVDFQQLLCDVVNGPVKWMVQAKIDKVDKKWEKTFQEFEVRTLPHIEPSPIKGKQKPRAPHKEVSGPYKPLVHLLMIAKDLVHKKMHALIGLSKNGMRVLLLLPAPLPPDAPRRLSSTGDELFNPEWNNGPTHKSNFAYLQKAVSLIMAEEEVSNKST